MTAKRHHGFTLIELLLVLLLLGTVMTVIIACFDGGFRVYSRVSAFGTGEVDAYIVGDRLARDLRNAFFYEDIPFSGSTYELTLTSLVDDHGGDGVAAVVVYRKEPGGSLLRTVTRLDDEQSSQVSEWLDASYRITFMFRPEGDGTTFDASGASYQDHWTQSTNVPIALRFHVEGERLVEGAVVRTLGVGPPGGIVVP